MVNGKKLKYWFGDVVFLKTDPDQLPRFITGVTIRPNGVTYGLTNSAYESWHYDFEISDSKNIIVSMS